jgi:ketosteroid isomerase-like protein
MFELQLKSLRDYVHAFNRHDAKAVAALYAEEAIFVERGEEAASAGTAAIAKDYQAHFDAFPDVTTAITRSWHWGDAVLFEFTEGGTQTGPHGSEKSGTGKKFGYVGASLLRFKPNGLVREDMTYSDELTKEVQVGWARGPLGKMHVRPVVPVPTPSDTWDVHQVGAKDVGQPKLVAARGSLYSKFSLDSDKAFLAGLTDDIVISSYDDPNDVRGKKEASGLFKEWKTTFPDGVVDAKEGWSVDGYVVLLGTFTGKKTGNWGPVKPTTRPYTMHFLDITKVDGNDTIQRVWSYANNYELLKTLGFQRDHVIDIVAFDPMNPN